MRVSALGERSPQSSSDSNDVGQISMNLMRVNGVIAPFKSLLTSSTNFGSPLVSALRTSGRSASSLQLARINSPKKLQATGQPHTVENNFCKNTSRFQVEVPIFNLTGKYF
ncbi:unnamed protein product [Thelazia callipaeda]|uniref:Uncharacterized protein n=1 Tax=Thelazia callipaeda TaxID=103827 RepID=A0A0N5D8T0_THECL|nr:unnamed protein product [Thelazia callipaeda]